MSTNEIIKTKLYHKSDVTTKPLNISINPTEGQPLNANEVWTSSTKYEGKTGFAALQFFAKSEKAYYGQKVAFINIIDGNYTITHYSIEQNGVLKELGVKPVGDGKSIAVSEAGEISIVGIEGAQALEVPRMNSTGTAIEWVPITAIVQGDGNTTYEFKDIKNTGNEKIGVKVIEHAVDPDTKEEVLTEKEFIFDFVSNKTFNNFKSTHEAQISGLNKEAKENRTKIEALNSDNTINKEKIDSLGTNLTTLEKKVATAETDINNLKTTLSTEAGYIDDLQGRMTTAETDIDKVEGRVGTVEGKVTTLESSMGQVTSGVGSLKTRMTTAEGEIDTLQSNMTTAKSDIEGLKTATSANKDEIGTDTTINEDGETVAATGLYGKIATEKARAEAAEGELSTRITNLSDTVTKDYATITYVNTEISKITHFTTEIVESIGDVTKEGVLYLIKDNSITGENKDVYKEYLFVGGQAVLIGDTTTDLSNYITNDALTKTLNAYYTSAQLDEKFAKYSTISEVESKIAKAKTEAGTATDDKLKNYVKTETFNSTIANYSTTGQIDKKLEPYAKTSDVNKSISDAIDTAGNKADTKISTALKDYTTTLDLEGSYLKKTEAQTTYITASKAATDIETARQSAVDHTNEELKKYTTTSIIKETYATKTEVEKVATDASAELTTKLADYAKTSDVSSTYVTKETYEDFVEDINDGNKTDKRLLKAEEISKLAKLSLSGDSLTISGSVSADNVTGIDEKIKGVVTGTTVNGGLGIEAGAEVNSVETITINGANGTKLTPDGNKNINIDLASTYYNKNEIDTQVGNINTAISGTDGINSKISTINTRLSALDTTTSSNTTAITAINNDLDGYTNSEGTAVSGIKSRLSAVETIAAEHTAITGAINKNTEEISEVSEDLSTLTGIVNSHTTTLTGDKTDGTGGLVGDVSNLMTTTSNHAGRLTALETTDTNANNRLRAIEEKVGKAAEGENAAITGTLETAINGLDTRLDTAEDEIDTLQTDLDTAEDAIKSLDGRLDTAEGTITGHGTRLTTAEGDIDVLQAQVTKWAGDLQTVIKRDSNGNKIVAKNEDGTDRVDENGKLVYETEQIDDHNLSIRQIAAQEIADIVDGANESYDTLKEIADWIASDITGAASMNSAITENAEDIGELQTGLSTANTNIAKNKSILDILVGGDISTTTPTKSITEMIAENKSYVDTNFVKKTDIATNSILGIVMGSTEENKISIASDGTMEVNSLNVNKLVQTEGDTFILCGGDAGASSQNA